MWIARKRYETLTKIQDIAQILMDYIGDAPFIAAEMVRRDRSGAPDAYSVALSIAALEALRSRINPDWKVK